MRWALVERVMYDIECVSSNTLRRPRVAVSVPPDRLKRGELRELLLFLFGEVTRLIDALHLDRLGDVLRPAIRIGFHLRLDHRHALL